LHYGLPISGLNSAAGSRHRPGGNCPRFRRRPVQRGGRSHRHQLFYRHTPYGRFQRSSTDSGGLDRPAAGRSHDGGVDEAWYGRIYRRLCIQRLEDNGLTPEKGRVLVDGASGGVGSIAVNMLDDRGYEVVASTGRTEEAEYLKSLGASKVIHRDQVTDFRGRATRTRQWAAAIDPVGG